GDRGVRATYGTPARARGRGARHREALVGKTADQVSPSRLGGSYMVQDRRVLAGETIENQLELHLYANRTAGWCLTFKRPLRDGERVTGLVGISRDLDAPDRQHSSFARLQRAV